MVKSTFKQKVTLFVRLQWYVPCLTGDKQKSRKQVCRRLFHFNLSLNLPPDSGDVGASLATLWKKWLADFEMFTVAAGIRDKTQKRALLLYQAGSRVREIVGQLEETGAADAYDTATSKLAAYFEPQTNRRYDVYCFRQAHQEPNETLDQYHTGLQTLAVPCEFEVNLTLELEEQVIIGELPLAFASKHFATPNTTSKPCC